MAVPQDRVSQLAQKFRALLPQLDERQRRLLLAAEARSLGHGGARAVATAAGVSATTVHKGIAELEGRLESAPAGRIRRSGGGRKRITEKNPDLLPALMALVEPDERGDPMSPLRWTIKSTRNLAEEMGRQGHAVSARTVGKLLRENGFSLQANVKSLSGEQHPDRDAQFHYINAQVKEHQAAGEPVVSVDTKKKEMLGQLPNPGRTWRPKDDPVNVEDHALFFGPDHPRAIPYGVYDITADTGWVNVGVDHDTSAFAVASIRRWWESRGRTDYPGATRLLITADAGGSNNYRYRLWKYELAAFAAETGLTITVCHFPPGASKWNKVEHRLFSHITMNWRGRPLTSHEVVVQTIASTRTRTGLRVEAELDTREYPTGLSVPKDEYAALPIESHERHGNWNYTVFPKVRPVATPPPRMMDETLDLLADPSLTGMSRQELAALTERLVPDQLAQAERRNHERRGGARLRAKGSGGKVFITDTARVLLAVLYLRQVCPQYVLAELLNVGESGIANAVADTARLLYERRVAIKPTPLRFMNAESLRKYLATGETPGPSPTELLADPSLTGMSREDLQQMIERLTIRHAAQIEKLRYQRRGEESRRPTLQVFQQKIMNSDRILVAILAIRRVASRELLAKLFGVSPRMIGNTLLEVRPLLKEDGYVPVVIPASKRFYTSEALFDSIGIRDPR
ncbi:ISAzo13 family transposase [Streptomyces ipomoeae]|uniref:ISAzo13 family transposase n=1 Tax=Streptomyces ipomoeae TaxID=103232 RepID=A0AAE9AZG6_9ACTN|nr:ISAzo13 family transposase [Streptomyces ipomoeae]TQE29143.1 ISAzo13 family transposase [Streptomyces ipomoeae]